MLIKYCDTVIFWIKVNSLCAHWQAFLVIILNILYADMLNLYNKQLLVEWQIVQTQIRLLLYSVLQIRMGKRDNLGIIFHITPLKHML